MAADPELAFIKGKLRDQFQGALTAALAALEDRERMIYRLHLIDGLTVEAIGKIYGVSHSTVSRWLAKARERVIAEAQRLLRDEMRLSPAEFESSPAWWSASSTSASRVCCDPARRRGTPAKKARAQKSADGSARGASPG